MGNAHRVHGLPNPSCLMRAYPRTTTTGADHLWTPKHVCWRRKPPWTMPTYAEWRSRGGFEPFIAGKRGDVFYGLLSTRYGGQHASHRISTGGPDGE